MSKRGISSEYDDVNDFLKILMRGTLVSIQCVGENGSGVVQGQDRLILGTSSTVPEGNNPQIRRLPGVIAVRPSRRPQFRHDVLAKTDGREKKYFRVNST